LNDVRDRDKGAAQGQRSVSAGMLDGVSGFMRGNAYGGNGVLAINRLGEPYHF